jgi:hypothetical protein
MFLTSKTFVKFQDIPLGVSPYFGIIISNQSLVLQVRSIRQVYVNQAARVTRLGDFSPFGRHLLWAVFRKLQY